ncbi:early nodulin-93-like isoform X2 [Aristolochia californica]|uniref:early nodulin-93-like isoform X2 n=1 Tax=Aristolochia californica TaxID=171875 RepID=UPI0035E21DE3
MGIPSEMRDIWINRRKTLLIASPEEDRILASKRCQQEGIRQGLKAASIVRVVTAVPTLVGVRVIPWAKANLNHTAQALIISAERAPVLEGLTPLHCLLSTTVLFIC